MGTLMLSRLVRDDVMKDLMSLGQTIAASEGAGLGLVTYLANDPGDRCAGGCPRDCRSHPRVRVRSRAVDQPHLQRRCQRAFRCRTQDHSQVERLTDSGGGGHRDRRESRAQDPGRAVVVLAVAVSRHDRLFARLFESLGQIWADIQDITN